MARMAIDVALALAAVAGVVLLVVPGRAEMGPPKPVLPEVEVRENARGEKLVTLDGAAWARVHELAGLPEPGAVVDFDPVPVRALTDAVARWIETGDADAIGAAGEVYLALEHHEAAARFFASAAALKPENARWSYLLGAELQTLGLIEPAFEALKKSATVDPMYATLHARLGELSLEMQDVLGAKQAFETVTRMEPNVSLGYVGLGRVALVEQDFEEARKQLERAVEVTPNDFRAWRMLSRAYGALGEVEKANLAARRAEHLPMYRGWLTFDQRLEEAHARANTQRSLENRANALVGAGQSREAIPLMEELVQRRPNDSEMIAMLGHQYLLIGDVAQAEAMSKRALELDPTFAAHHTLRAMVYLTNDQYERALMSLDEAIRLDGRFAPAYEVRGRVLLLQKEPIDAAEALREAVRLDPKALGARYMLAIALAQSGERDQARDALEALLELEPGHGAARQMLQSLRE